MKTDYRKVKGEKESKAREKVGKEEIRREDVVLFLGILNIQAVSMQQFTFSVFLKTLVQALTEIPLQIKPYSIIFPLGFDIDI